MGMYSTLINEEIKVLNPKAIAKLSPKETDNLIENKKLNFYNLSNSKIEGYWSDETINALNKIAPHIEGYLEFIYEEGYFFRIVFKEGKVYTQHQKNINYHEPVLLINRV